MRDGGVRRILARWALMASAAMWLAACASTSVKARPPIPAGKEAAQHIGKLHLSSLDLDASINRIISHMSLDQKIAQMQMVEFEGTDYNADLDGMINGAGVGALIIYNNNARTIPQMQALLSQVQARAQIPVMTALDQEGGDVNRLAEFYGPAPSAQQMAATGNPQVAHDQGALAAQRLQTLGFNTDLAPVVDVSDGGNDIEGIRLWSTDPVKTALFAGQFLDGLQSTNVVGCLKHWPGIGSITKDPHDTLPTLTHDAYTLQTVDFAPFEALFSHNPAMIMDTDVLVPAYDNYYPAELSPTLITGVLRNQLDYQGVIITDALIMKGIQNTWPLGQASVLAVLAGNDILETGFDTGSTNMVIASIHQAVVDGTIPESRIDDSVRRILRLKWDYGMDIAKLNALAGH